MRRKLLKLTDEQEKTLVLGLDVGFRHTGWVVAEIKDNDYNPIDCGCIHTEKASKKDKVLVCMDDFNNLCYLFRELGNICDKYSVKAIMAELPSGGAQSAAAMKAMGIASAVIAGFVESRKLPFEPCTPIQNKVALTGKKTASKTEMQLGAVTQYPTGPWPAQHVIKTGKNKGGHKFPPWFEHTADAMGALIACKDSQTFRFLANG